MAAHDGASSSSSSSSSVSLPVYDVFLSFRGKDTRNIFTGFLHSALKREGINVFIDSEGLWGGEEIQTALLDAIQQSKISIPVFSKGYADSKWCLMELVEIVRCHRCNNQKVLPIFLDVEPRDVRHQTGSFEGSFQKHMERYDAQKIQSWKDALTEVAGKSGYELKQVNGNQAELVKLVVDWALSELSSNCLSDVKNPVGLDARVEDLLSRLKVDSNDVWFVGVCAIGGMGKTSIAKTLYNRIFKSFEMSCFLGNVREEASLGPHGLISLQEKLIYSVSKKEEKICSVDRGKHLIKEKLQGKKVLLILDDVDSHSQLKDLAIESISFGPGSRIIITTRDEHVLNVAKIDGDNIYRPQELDDKQSLQLFSLHAFSNDQPPEDYSQLSYDVINLAGGLPLTLEVLGSTFSDKENREEQVWKSMLQELKRIPPDDVNKKLRISYDKLNDTEKSIFLDAACFFVGLRKEITISIWDACGFNPISAIKKLTQRSLLKFITISHWLKPYDVLSMHDQIQAMGRGIVYEESPTEPTKHSRIWSHEEILEAIEEPQGAQMLEVIYTGHHLGTFKMQGSIPQRNFAMMSKLRVLDVYIAKSKGDFPHLPPNLRWFSWNNLLVPANFYHKKLVHMDLSGSQIREAWTNKPQNENQRFQKLKVLILKWCDVSHKSFDFSWFPYLETLDLEGCRNIINLHKSIGDLKSLVELNLTSAKIEELPNDICRLSSLKVLSLRWCTSLKNLPKSIGDLKSLVKLDLQGTRIEEIPCSICKLSSLTQLNLNDCKSLNKLPDGDWLSEKLEKLEAKNCHNLVKLPTSWGRMRCLHIIHLIGTRTLLPGDDSVMLPNLVQLHIGNDHEASLPPWISGLPRLQCLILDGYTRLKSLPDLPSTLTSLTVWSCSSLQTIPDLSSLTHLTSLRLNRCKELKEIRSFEQIVESLERLEVHKCKYLVDTQRWKIHGQGTLLVDKMSQGVDFSSLNVNDGVDKGLILCVVFEFKQRDAQAIVEEGQLVDIFLSIAVSICRQKHGRIRSVSHEVQIEGVKFTSMQDIIYVHHFKGFDWFGIPLEPGIDAIKDISVFGETVWSTINCNVKFWKVWLESTASEQTQQQITNQEEGPITTTARRMVADFFNWSDDEDLGRSHHHIVPAEQGGSRTHKTIHHFTSSSSNTLEIRGSNSVVPQQADEESSNETINSHNDLRLGLGLPDQRGSQAGGVAEDPNISQALGLLRAGKRARLDVDDAAPSGA